jgi:hypothetical protein
MTARCSDRHRAFDPHGSEFNSVSHRQQNPGRPKSLLVTDTLHGVVLSKFDLFFNLFIVFQYLN